MTNEYEIIIEEGDEELVSRSTEIMLPTLFSPKQLLISPTEKDKNLSKTLI